MIVSVDSLSKRYGRNVALDGVSLAIRPNELFALLGPNGAGKTTLIHILCTILRPDSGNVTLAGFDSSTLLSYYQSKLPTAPTTSTLTSATQAANSATANDNPPWETTPPAQQARDAQVLATTNFVDTSNVPLSAGTTTDGKTEQDNQKLFSLYSAVNSLSYLASMAGRDGETSGQMDGINTRFQAGLAQVQSYISNTTEEQRLGAPEYRQLLADSIANAVQAYREGR